MEHRSVEAASALLRELLRPHGHVSAGVTFARPGSWSEGDMRALALPDGRRLRMAHDEREAPVVVSERGAWQERPLVSLSDEGSLAAFAWADVPRDSPVRGIGIDLADRADFAGARGERFNHLLFTERELALAPLLAPEDRALGYAYAFSAKEAAFKSCAEPLRAWYRAHDEELLFDLRSFELADEHHERGTARRAEAQRAMDLLGIGRIKLARMPLGSLALTLAIALEAERPAPAPMAIPRG